MYKKRVPAKFVKIVPRIFRARLHEDGLSITNVSFGSGLSRGTLHTILKTGKVYELAALRLKQFGIDPASLIKKEAKK
jgi:lambda repressor-like predicted transcriptional regulator